jgi:DNA-binding GntR family transcriptional regulator
MIPPVIPKFRQLEAAIKARIVSGEYSPGAKIPSEHELAREFGVSRLTVVRALEDLRKSGWIYTRTGKGSFAYRPGPRKISLFPGDAASVTVKDASGTPVLVVEITVGDEL